MEDYKRNGSGYVDTTAYQAIKNYLKGEDDMDFYQGDIFKGELTNGGEKEFIVVSVHDRFCTTLMLSENDSLPYQVICNGMKYTNPGMLQYMYKDRLTSFVRSMKKDEFTDLLQNIVDSLGYEGSAEPVINEVIKLPDTATATAETLVELSKVKAERDIYKKLYDDLISGLMAR